MGNIKSLAISTELKEKEKNQILPIISREPIILKPSTLPRWKIRRARSRDDVLSITSPSPRSNRKPEYNTDGLSQTDERGWEGELYNLQEAHESTPSDLTPRRAQERKGKEKGKEKEKEKEKEELDKADGEYENLQNTLAIQMEGRQQQKEAINERPKRSWAVMPASETYMQLIMSLTTRFLQGEASSVAPLDFREANKQVQRSEATLFVL